MRTAPALPTGHGSPDARPEPATSNHTMKAALATMISRLVGLACAVLFLSTAACAEESPAPPEEASVPVAESDARTGDAPDWAIDATGAGPLWIGMTLSEMEPHIVRSEAPAEGSTCRYVSIAGAPDSVWFMVDQGRLARIDVRGGATPTREGARVGDTEAQVESLYPGVRRTPHKYEDGSYLVALPGAPADTMHRLVFETDGERVTAYRAGIFPQVEWVEGCG